MSTRTIIEINHDRIDDLRNDPDQFKQLLLLLSLGGAANPKVWKHDIGIAGIRILCQRHHSETLTLTVD